MLHSANVIQIALMAIFPHFWIDFLQMFLCRPQFCFEETKDRVLFKKILLRDRVSFSGI